MLSYILVGVLLFAIIGAIVYAFVKKISLEEMMVKESTKVFSFAASISTFLEVISLSQIAISRGIDPFAAYSRNILTGAFEALISVLFISLYVILTDRFRSNGRLNVFFIIPILLITAPLFFMSYVITTQIYMLYLESINRFEVIQGDTSPIWAIFNIKFENNPENYIYIDSGDVGKIEYGAIILIYSTTLINILLIFLMIVNDLKNGTISFSVKDFVKQIKDIVAKKIEKEKANTPDSKLEPFVKNNGLASYYKIIATLGNITEKKVNEWIYSLIGVNPITGDIVTDPIEKGKMHHTVASGQTTPLQFLEDLSKKLVGDYDQNKVEVLQDYTAANGLMGYQELKALNIKYTSEKTSLKNNNQPTKDIDDKLKAVHMRITNLQSNLDRELKHLGINKI